MLRDSAAALRKLFEGAPGGDRSLWLGPAQSTCGERAERGRGGTRPDHGREREWGRGGARSQGGGDRRERSQDRPRISRISRMREAPCRTPGGGAKLLVRDSAILAAILSRSFPPVSFSPSVVISTAWNGCGLRRMPHPSGSASVCVVCGPPRSNRRDAKGRRAAASQASPFPFPISVPHAPLQPFAVPSPNRHPAPGTANALVLSRELCVPLSRF